MPLPSDDSVAAECLESEILTEDATDGIGEGGSGLYSCEDAMFAPASSVGSAFVDAARGCDCKHCTIEKCT
jgi:hypothetical protein